MSMVSMKRTKADEAARKKEMNTACIASPGDDFPYGLRIDLNTESLDKLGLKTLPKVGTKMLVTCEVEVCRVSQNSRTNGSDDRSMELQIQRMELSKRGAASAEDAVSMGIEEADEY